MPVTEYPELTPDQEKKLKLAVEGNCELCSEYCAFPFPEIHQISKRHYHEMTRDPLTRILVVCQLCHRHRHQLAVRVRDQHAIVFRRSFLVQQDIRKIPGSTPKPYAPPDDTDTSRTYEDYFYHVPPGSFRLGG